MQTKLDIKFNKFANFRTFLQLPTSISMTNTSTLDYKYLLGKLVEVNFEKLFCLHILYRRIMKNTIEIIKQI